MRKPPLRPGSDEEWTALLHQLRQLPPAQPQPFFYARVHARLVAQTAPAKGGWLDWVRRPAYVALLGLLGLAVSGDGMMLPPAAPHVAGPTAQLLSR